MTEINFTTETDTETDTDEYDDDAYAAVKSSWDAFSDDPDTKPMVVFTDVMRAVHVHDVPKDQRADLIIDAMVESFEEMMTETSEMLRDELPDDWQ